MAFASFMHTQNLNHVTYFDDIRSEFRSFSLGKVFFPKNMALSSSKQSLVASDVSSLAHAWREIQGSNNWENLVKPLHPLLRQEIIRYGEFVSACYKALNLDPTSKRYLNCKYGKKSMFKEIGMENSGYEVTKYIYATPDINISIPAYQSCGRWIGYVAVSSTDASKRIGRKDIIITFRGTITNLEWITNLMSTLTPAQLDPNNWRPEVKVELGFLTLYTSNESGTKFGLGSCREQLLSEISRLLKKHQNEELSITLAGHSMGSSLAILLAYDIAELGLNKNSEKHDIPITVYSFGGPRVGNSCFKKHCEELGVKILLIVNVNDPITKLPGFFFNENFRVLKGYEFYVHVGVELMLDSFTMEKPLCVHDLEMYIRLLEFPKNVENQIDGLGFLDRAREFVLNAQNANILPWTCVVRNFVSFFFWSQGDNYFM